MIRTNIRILELLSQEKQEIEAQINALIKSGVSKELDSPIKNLKSIPGVSDKTIAAILGECGDLRRFTSAKALIGYLGLYPSCKERYPHSKACTLYGCCLFCFT